MRSVRLLLALAAASAAVVFVFPAHSHPGGVAYSLEKIWETPLDADSIGMLVAGCPDGSAYVISSYGTIGWISPQGVPSRRSAKVASYDDFLYAVCDAKRSVYLVGTHIRIFEAGPDGASSLVGEGLPSDLTIRFAVLRVVPFG